MTKRIIERQVKLPGQPPRTIAIFGESQPTVFSAHPSPRWRSDTVEEGCNRAASYEIGSIASPMDGLLVELCVNMGQEVSEGETLAILEAMKMEVVLRAPISGIVQEIGVAAGMPVQKGQLLITLE